MRERSYGDSLLRLLTAEHLDLYQLSHCTVKHTKQRADVTVWAKKKKNVSLLCECFSMINEFLLLLKGLLVL